MFWTRLASGVVLLAIAAGTMGLGGIPLALLLWAASLGAFRELTRALGVGENGISCLELIGFLGITGYYLLLYFMIFFLKLQIFYPDIIFPSCIQTISSERYSSSSVS